MEAVVGPRGTETGKGDKWGNPRSQAKAVRRERVERGRGRAMPRVRQGEGRQTQAPSAHAPSRTHARLCPAPEDIDHQPGLGNAKEKGSSRNSSSSTSTSSSSTSTHSEDGRRVPRQMGGVTKKRDGPWGAAGSQEGDQRAGQVGPSAISTLPLQRARAGGRLSGRA